MFEEANNHIEDMKAQFPGAEALFDKNKLNQPIKEVKVPEYISFFRQVRKKML